MGAGFAGSALAIALQRRGVSVALLERRKHYPSAFKAEKFEPGQWRLLQKHGLLEKVLPVCHPITGIYVSRRGRIQEKKGIVQYGFLYHDLINQMRSTYPEGLNVIWQGVNAVEQQGDDMLVTLSDATLLRARIVILATGDHDVLQQQLGIGRRVIEPQHSMHFGFDISPSDGDFWFDALTYHGEEVPSGVDYITLFRIPGAMRANLCTYWKPGDKYAEAMATDARGVLDETLPGLSRAAGAFDVTGEVRSRAIELSLATGVDIPGIVLVADSYQSSCPATGTGLSKLMTDVDVLLDGCVQRWLVTPGMGSEKISTYYNDARKRETDARSLDMAITRRKANIPVPITQWRARRLRRALRRMRNRITRALGFMHPKAVWTNRAQFGDAVPFATLGHPYRNMQADAGALSPKGFLVQYLKRPVKKLVWRAHPGLLDRISPYRGQEFSIGMLGGESPLALEVVDGVRNPVVSRTDVDDVPAGFVADPFMLRREGRWFMFLETFDRIEYKGVIGLATSDDGVDWRYQRTVLAEPFHLAFPHMVEVDGEVYMVPDSPTEGVRLYRAVQFPLEWEFEKALVTGTRVSDSVVFEHNGRWWMMNAWTRTFGDPVTLRLFSAPHIDGDWYEHPASPLVHDHSTSRAGGRVVGIDGRLFRFAQDGLPYYGSCVRAFEILELDDTRYSEREVEGGAVLHAGREAWHSGGMHHLDAHLLGDGRWLACVDGWKMVGGRLLDSV